MFAVSITFFKHYAFPLKFELGLECLRVFSKSI
jgi:hypothetical protein